MKTRHCCLMLLSVVSCVGDAFSADTTQADVPAFGADAAVNVFVHDETGNPITNARVRCGFWFKTEEQSPSVFGRTDRTGHFLAKAKCNADVLALVRHEGFYWSSVRKRFGDTTARPKVVDGKWQPYGAELPVLMRKVVNPIALDRHSFTRDIPATNQWIGLDMEKGAFVKPFGDGEVQDLEFLFDWDGKVRKQYSGSALHVRFPGDCAGGYWFDRVKCSDYELAMSADTNAAYQAEFEFSSTKTADGWIEHLFGNERSLVVRTRCRTDAEKRLRSAMYAQIHSLAFGWGSRGHGWIRLGYERNPKVNDPNLESDHVVRTMKDIERKMDWLPSVK